MSVKRGIGLEVYLFRFRVSVNPNPNRKTAFFQKGQSPNPTPRFTDTPFCFSFFFYLQGLDCSQSPIFSSDRLDIPRLLTVTAILILKCTEGAGVGDYGWGRGKGEKNRGPVYFSRFLPNRPRPLGSFDTHARWVARNAKLSISMILRKNRRLWTVYTQGYDVQFILLTIIHK